MQLTGKVASGSTVSSKSKSKSKTPFVPALLFFGLFSLLFFQVGKCRAAQARLDVRARAAVVMDGQTHKLLYAKNPDLRLLPASTTKLVTAMVVLDKLSPGTMVVVSREAAYTPSIPPHLIPGEWMSVRDLLYFALMRSINGAAVALAQAVSGSESAFTALMNEKAASLGAKETRYVNSTGLPAPGQYITASDLALIIDGALRYPLIRKIIHTREKMLDVDGRDVLLRNDDELLWSYHHMIGGKTGYTGAAENCLAFAASRDGCTLVGALLGERVRGNLWFEGKRLLEKSFLVANGTASPEIYKSPVVLTSYEPPRRHYWRRRVLTARYRRLRAERIKRERLLAARKRMLDIRYRHLLLEKRIRRERLLAARKRMLARRYRHHTVIKHVPVRHRVLRERSRLAVKPHRRTTYRTRLGHGKTVASRASLGRKKPKQKILRRRVRLIARHYLAQEDVKSKTPLRPASK